MYSIKYKQPFFFSFKQIFMSINIQDYFENLSRSEDVKMFILQISENTQNPNW